MSTPAERAVALLQEAIGVLSGQSTGLVTQGNVDAAAAQYLRENSDVAGHAYYGKHPLEHWHQHGRAEGRKWPTIGTTVVDELPGWPPGSYRVGANVFVPHGATNAGPFTQPSEYESWVRRVEGSNANLAEADRELNATTYTGQFQAANFIHGPQEGREAAFIYAARCLLRDKGGPNLYTDCGLFSGTHDDISRLINYGEQEQIYEQKSYQQTVADFPDMPLKRAVMEKLS